MLWRIIEILGKEKVRPGPREVGEVCWFMPDNLFEATARG
jgi:hypothetical protein